MTTKSYSIFETASDQSIFVDDLNCQYSMVEEVEVVLARAFVGAQEIGEREIMDEIHAELDAIDQWKEAIDYCDEQGIDTTDSAAFMGELLAS